MLKPGSNRASKQDLDVYAELVKTVSRTVVCVLCKIPVWREKEDEIEKVWDGDLWPKSSEDVGPLKCDILGGQTAGMMDRSMYGKASLVSGREDIRHSGHSGQFDRHRDLLTAGIGRGVLLVVGQSRGSFAAGLKPFWGALLLSSHTLLQSSPILALHHRDLAY